MAAKTARDVVNDIEGRYISKTLASKALFEEGCKYLPGGDTRNTSHFKPYTIFMERGKGCHIWDYDGNKYIDMLNNYTSMVHGHAHPEVTKAVCEQAKKGTALCGPGSNVSKLAKIITQRVPGMDFIRFCNSGTEANLFALRAAKAHTGRDGFIKMHCGFHGTSNHTEVSVFSDKPEPMVEGRGIPVSVLNDVYVAIFNDLDSVEAILKKHKDKIACIIVEPILGIAGFIPAEKNFLAGLRTLADKYNVLLVFDEVVTFRLSTGGMQKLYGVTPDLTVLGKSIGGGLPIGAFGGKKEIMCMFDPRKKDTVFHSGTFCGNHLTMAAGVAAMEALDEDSISRINKLGNQLRNRINTTFKENNIAGQATGTGSLLHFHWSDIELKTGGDTLKTFSAAKELPRLLIVEMLNQGVYIGPKGKVNVSTPITGKEINKVIDALSNALQILKPYIAQVHPHLLKD